MGAGPVTEREWLEHGRGGGQLLSILELGHPEAPEG